MTRARCTYCEPALAPRRGAPTMCPTCFAAELTGTDPRQQSLPIPHSIPSAFRRAIDRLRRAA